MSVSRPALYQTNGLCFPSVNSSERKPPDDSTFCECSLEHFATDTQPSGRGAFLSISGGTAHENLQPCKKSAFSLLPMNLSPFRFRQLAVLAPWLALVACPTARTEPFVPKDGQQVLERLRAKPFDPEARQLREMRTRLAAQPQNLELATQFAWQCLQRSRAEADPRYLGRAQAALGPWWTMAQPPIEALVLRATIRQSQHDFTNALNDLNLAIELAPGNPQAWLTRATILTVLGRYDEARRACLPLVGRAPELLTITAAAQIASVTGEAERSCSLLQRVLDGHPSSKAEERLWALTVLAETSARSGHLEQADHSFQKALALGQRDAYLLGAYADFLLDTGRAKEAVTLLKDETRADSLLLRLALAESCLQPHPASFEPHVTTLRARFEAAHLRCDNVHQREEARFLLILLHKPEEALRLAQANWQIQREPADARILLEASLATKRVSAAQPVLDFLRRTNLEDIELDRLKAQLGGLSYAAQNPERTSR
jgi:Flp pilus assembly protein TadD